MFRFSFILLLLFGALGLPEPGFSQELLKPEDALALTLENNLGLKVQQKDSLIAQNNVSWGNAGFLPELSLNGRLNGSLSNNESEFLDGRTQSVNAARTRQRSASIDAQWVLFDGLRMFYNYESLKLNQQSTRLALRLRMEDLMVQTLANYYNLVQLKKQNKILLQNLDISRQRREVARDRFEIGTFSRADWIRARVDFNNDSTELILQEQLRNEAWINLNTLFGQSNVETYKIIDSIQVEILNIEALKTQLNQQNTEVLIARNNQELALKSLEISRANRLPSLTADLNYRYFNSQSDAGFLTSNQTTGFNYGISLRYPLFSGFNRKREQQNAQINLEQSRGNIQSIELTSQNNFEIALRNYRNLEGQLALALSNIALVEQNLDIAIERYRLGDISALEFRDAQLLALEEASQVNQLEFALKLLEIDIRRISGDLVKDRI